jgi:hypothetical protein
VQSLSEDAKLMSKRRIVVLDAPSNLGLRPPETGAVPGCYKLPWALRDRKLLQAIEATDAGVIIPPRYRAEWQPGQGDRNAEAIALFSIALADRVCALVEQQAAVQALGTVASATQGFWIHLDVDVVDSSEMAAVDSPEPNGVPFRTLTQLLTQLVASPFCAGLEVTIYDPDLDPTGACADQLRQCLSDALRGESQPTAMGR